MPDDTVDNSITGAAGTHPGASPAALMERPHLHGGGVPHQFDDHEQQHEATTLGMWTFLATEILFFGALLTCYAVYRYLYPHAFAEASHHLKKTAGTLNTAVLLCSSLAMALAVRAAQLHKPRDLVRWLLITIVLGSAFLGVKAFEYWAEYRDGLVPQLNFRHHGENAPQVELFMSFYFILTGLHALHMIIGLGLMLILVILARRGYFEMRHSNLVEMSGLYWHFVDIVWIFLFPLLYLIR